MRWAEGPGRMEVADAGSIPTVAIGERVSPERADRVTPRMRGRGRVSARDTAIRSLGSERGRGEREEGAQELEPGEYAGRASEGHIERIANIFSSSVM